MSAPALGYTLKVAGSKLPQSNVALSEPATCNLQLATNNLQPVRPDVSVAHSKT